MMIYSNELGYECLEMICFSKDHEVLHGCWVKWSCGFFNMFQHCHSQPIFVNNKSNSRCMGTWASCNLIMDKLLYRLDCFATFIQGHVVCLNTNSSQTGYVVHHIQHSERACMDIHWSQFAMDVCYSFEVPTARGLAYTPSQLVLLGRLWFQTWGEELFPHHK